MICQSLLCLTLLLHSQHISLSLLYYYHYPGRLQQDLDFTFPFISPFPPPHPLTSLHTQIVYHQQDDITTLFLGCVINCSLNLEWLCHGLALATVMVHRLQIWAKRDSVTTYLLIFGLGELSECKRHTTKKGHKHFS